MLFLYARREPTTDTVAKAYAPHAKLSDIVFYRDEHATRFYARHMWDATPLTKRHRYVFVNCWRWNVVWLPDVPHNN